MPAPFLEQTWRWFGPCDSVPLAHIRQAGATGIVTALHHIPCGAVWSMEEIQKRKDEIEGSGLTWSVVESVPVHDAIKQGSAAGAIYLAKYTQTLRNLAACGLRTVCYNFMPLLDWTRTDSAWILPDGSEALRFDAADAAVFDLYVLKRSGAAADYPAEMLERAAKRFSNASAQSLNRVESALFQDFPGAEQNFTLDHFRNKLGAYAQIDSARLRENHAAFLRYVIPVAHECGIVLCIHPDDPPFPIFGLPRIASTEQDLETILAAFDSPSNGITFCSGSLGAHPDNDLPALFRKVGHRVHFVHLRNVQREPDGSFYESDHLEGSIDMAALMQVILEELDARVATGRSSRLPMRPDHAHRMLGDLTQPCVPGYSAIGRLKALAELRGLERGLRHAQRIRSS